MSDDIRITGQNGLSIKTGIETPQDGNRNLLLQPARTAYPLKQGLKLREMDGDDQDIMAPERLIH